MSRKAHNRRKTVVSAYAGFACPVQNMHATAPAGRRDAMKKTPRISMFSSTHGAWHFNCSWETHAAPITVGAVLKT